MRGRLLVSYFISAVIFAFDCFYCRSGGREYLRVGEWVCTAIQEGRGQGSSILLFIVWCLLDSHSVCQCIGQMNKNFRWIGWWQLCLGCH